MNFWSELVCTQGWGHLQKGIKEIFFNGHFLQLNFIFGKIFSLSFLKSNFYSNEKNVSNALAIRASQCICSN
jgi:hypothetical protein